MATATETMKRFMEVLKKYANDTTTSGIEILNDAVRSVSRFNGLEDAVNSFVNDVGDSSKIADVRQRLLETCGIVLGKDGDFFADTGAAIGYNAGGNTVFDAQSIVPETGTLAELSMPTAGSTTTHSYTTSDGKTFTFKIEWPKSFTQATDRKWQTFSTYDPNAWTEVELTNQTFTSDNNHNENTKTYTAEQYRKSIETISKGMAHWWATESAKLIYESYGLDFNGKTLKVSFNFNQAGLQADTGPIGKGANDTTPADVIEMSFSLPSYGVIDPSDVNGNTRVDGGNSMNYLDRTVAHEMVHALMQGSGTLKGYEEKHTVKGMPEFFTEGVAELIMGLDDYDGDNTTEILELANDKKKLANAMAIAGGTGTRIRYTSGYMFLRYLAQQSLEAEDILAAIESKIDSNSEDLLLQAVSGYSPTQVAMMKSMDYMAPNDSLNVNNDLAVSNDDLMISALIGNGSENLILGQGTDF